MTAPYAMTAEEHQLLNEFLGELLGLTFPDEKKPILESRLRPRLLSLGLTRFMDYYLLLQYDLAAEVDQLTHAVTNNETYFFRETRQFEALFEEVFDDLREGATIPGKVRLLCAGCSSGEEPYSLRVFAVSRPAQLAGSELVIDAFDVDNERVARARRAVYGPHSLRSTTEEQIHAYFRRSGSEQFVLQPPFRDGVRFVHGNILDESTYPSRMAYDVLFCRNVLIYFSETALHRAIRNFGRALRPGGYLFLGHSESLIGVTAAFETVRLNKCIAYRKAR